MARFAINGFGRIGRNVFCAAQESSADIKIVTVNNITNSATLAHLLKYNSIYKPFQGEVAKHNESLIVNGREVSTFLGHERFGAVEWR